MPLHPDIPAPLVQALSKRNFTTLTPVQEAVLADGLSGRDLLVSAQTGSGKTIAFGLALAPSLLGDAERLPQAGPPRALVIAPTRELALQVTRELSWLYAPAGGRLTTCIGGMDMRDERRALEQGVHIVVGTPGRLADHVKRGSLDLSELETVVLDEADEMLDMGFREELELILTAVPQQRRTLMFSATVSKQIARLTENFQTDAVRINTVSPERSHIDIDYQALAVDPGDVENAVINLLLFHDAQTSIVFCSRRESVNKLTARLTNRGFSVVALSGEFSQKERTNSLQALRDGRARVCVATDVAARGLDLPGLDLVIHADLPRNREGLLHRSGRTGRAGRKGVSALIVPMRARRRIERVLQEAGVTASWGTPPGAAEIAARLDASLLAHAALQAPPSEAESALIAKLLDRHGAEQLAAGFLRLGRKAQAAPEDLREIGRVAPAEHSSGPSRPRSDFDDSAWVVLSVGRKTNADPKWLLPMLCKAGGFKRDQIGAIRIGATTTHVELRPDAAETLLGKAGAKGVIDKSLSIAPASGPPSEASPPPRKPRKPKRPGKPGHKGAPQRPRSAEAGGRAAPKHHKAKAPGRAKPPRKAKDGSARKPRPPRK